MSNNNCKLDAEGHCVTCSDEALPTKIVRIDQERGLAFVMLEGTTEEQEIDITLIDHVEPGDTVLVHGGVAIGSV